MTQAEIKQGYRRALSVLKMLNCTICSKTFRSFLGMVLHAEVCGKSVCFNTHINCLQYG